VPGSMTMRSARKNEGPERAGFEGGGPVGAGLRLDSGAGGRYGAAP
jgi:hypothetical protein